MKFIAMSRLGASLRWLDTCLQHTGGVTVNLYVVLDLQIRESVGLGERGAPLATGCGRDYGSARHRNTVGHPSHDRCHSEQIQGHQARICKCGGQGYRHGTQREVGT